MNSTEIRVIKRLTEQILDGMLWVDESLSAAISIFDLSRGKIMRLENDDPQKKLLLVKLCAEASAIFKRTGTYLSSLGVKKRRSKRIFRRRQTVTNSKKKSPYE